MLESGPPATGGEDAPEPLQVMGSARGCAKCTVASRGVVCLAHDNLGVANLKHVWRAPRGDLLLADYTEPPQDPAAWLFTHFGKFDKSLLGTRMKGLAFPAHSSKCCELRS